MEPEEFTPAVMAEVPVNPKVPGIASRPQTVRRPLPDFTDPTGLAAVKPLVRDGHTAVFHRIDNTTPALWRPQADNDVQPNIPAPRRADHDDTPSARHHAGAEDSHEWLPPLTPKQRVDAEWFRADGLRVDESAKDRTLRQFLDRWAVIGAAPVKPPRSRLDVTALDTSIFATVAASQFQAPTTTGKRAAS